MMKKITVGRSATDFYFFLIRHDSEIDPVFTDLDSVFTHPWLPEAVIFVIKSRLELTVN
jgi:hypothetical protein